MKPHIASHGYATDPVTGQVTAQVAGEVTGQVTGQVEAQEAQASLIPTEISGEQLPKLLDELNEVLAA